jgi:hypothetical protein
MMILTAVILLIGFIALAGMVARVNQLSSQTAIESERIILREVGPLAESMNSAICKLKESTLSKPNVADGVTTLGSPTITSATAAFTEADIGMVVAGTGILPSSRIIAVPSATSATLSAAVAASGTGLTFRFSPCLPTGASSTFDLSTTTMPTLEVALAGILDHLQALQAAHGLFMGWEIGCEGGNPAQGQVTAHLWDGTVWVEVKSAVYFTRAAC